MVEQTENFHEIPEFLKEKRRMFARFQSRFPVRIKDTRQDFGTNTYLHNASAEGVKITTKERLYINDSITLEVELFDGKGPMTVRGAVVWTKKSDNDMLEVGLKFHRIEFMNMWRLYQSAKSGSTV
jgi:Tfp pilus assembly protein PilZ